MGEAMIFDSVSVISREVDRPFQGHEGTDRILHRI